MTTAAALGWLHDFTRHWTVPMASLAAVALMQAAAGFGVGRNRSV